MPTGKIELTHGAITVTVTFVGTYEDGETTVSGGEGTLLREVIEDELENGLAAYTPHAGVEGPPFRSWPAIWTVMDRIIRGVAGRNRGLVGVSGEVIQEVEAPNFPPLRDDVEY